MTVATPPSRPGTGRDRDLEQRVADLEALIEEARRRARRRRQRNSAAVLVAFLGALFVYSLAGAGRNGTAPFVASGAARLSVDHPRAALPEELSFNANGSVILLGRDGRLHPFVSGIFHLPGKRYPRVYRGLDWSRDGSQLLALRSGRELVVTDTAGKIVWTVHSTALDGRWSPDGTRIAFVRHEPGLGRVLFVASTDGRRLTRIAAHVQVGNPAFSWSPDGTELAYAVHGAAGLMLADSSGRRAPRRIPIAPSVDAVSTVKWSPDGSRIAFDGSHVNVVRPDGTSFRRVADDACGFDWSPDGNRLAILTGPGPVCGHISVVNADGTRLQQIARCRCDLLGEASILSVAWSHDGTRIAYISGRGNTVSTIRPDGSGATVVATQSVRGRDVSRYPAVPLWRPTPVH